MNTHNKLLVSMVTLITALSIAACDKGGVDKDAKRETTIVAGGLVDNNPAADPVDDIAITTKVKSALLAEPTIKSFDIQVETHKGEVQLSGFVDNQEQIDRATAVAKEVQGVKNVSNKMTVKTAGSTVGDKIDDGLITTKVKAALLANDTTKGTDISVETRNGEVQLSGFVASQAEIDQATDVARGVEGVNNVINKMSVKG